MRPLSKKTLYLLSAGLILIGLALLSIGINRPVTLVVDGRASQIHTRALTVSAALQAAGYPPQPEDWISPGLQVFPLPGARIIVERARPISLFLTSDSPALKYRSSQRIPANLLLEAGIRLFPGDSVEWNGLRVEPSDRLPSASEYAIQFHKAREIRLVQPDAGQVIYSSQPTLRAALAEAGLDLGPSDWISVPLDTPLDGNLTVNLRHSQPVVIQIGSKRIKAQTSALTIGQALAQVGIPLTGLDYSQPAEDQPLPKDGVIHLVQVREEIVLEQQPLPFETEYIPDDQTELDTQRVITEGQTGLQVTRVRVRYEDGKETSRTQEAQWIARQPTARTVGMGTKPVVQTMSTPDGKIEYYRKVTVYATSYAPCEIYTDHCSYVTASGATLTKGIVAVTRSWYNLFAHQRVYIPGYGIGTIEDIGGGVPGSYWIDLGYDDANYVPWHSNVTIYFLTPVPDTVPWILP